ncbi:MAG: adaptor protein MecA [Clostridia bacterium]|nr:adaptor protein MecA [Clostridia bacterium]
MIISQMDNRICVKLTSQDMMELDITYEELDYSNIETRRVLWTLLDEARHKLGRNIHLTQKMIVEAVPDNDGGCTIYFTVNDEKNAKNGKKQLVKLTGTRIICSSDNIDNMGELAKVLSANGKITKSELFTDGSAYRMIIRPDISISDSIESVVCEFCDICDDSVAAGTYEHWKMLASPDAIGVLWALSD